MWLSNELIHSSFRIRNGQQLVHKTTILYMKRPVYEDSNPLTILNSRALSL